MDFSERVKHGETYALHCDLLRLRREDPVFSRSYAGGIDGAVLSDGAFVLRFFAKDNAQDRLLLVNLGKDLSLSPAPEPLLAPPEGEEWRILWSSEHPRYGGQGVRPMRTDSEWVLTGHSALVLVSKSELGE